MQFFALETNHDKILQKFASGNEEYVMTVFYDGFLFFLSILKGIAFTAVLIAVAVAAYLYTPLTIGWIVLGTLVIWLLVVPLPLLRRYIDWKYDFIYVTGEKVVVVDQSFLFHQKIKQINLENIASVSAETQYLNLFTFGIVRLNLKEGHGEEIVLRFVPKPNEVSDKIADTVSAFERRNEKE